jgi:hypothetical protein
LSLGQSDNEEEADRLVSAHGAALTRLGISIDELVWLQP